MKNLITGTSLIAVVAILTVFGAVHLAAPEKTQSTDVRADMLSLLKECREHVQRQPEARNCGGIQ